MKLWWLSSLSRGCNRAPREGASHSCWGAVGHVFPKFFSNGARSIVASQKCAISALLNEEPHTWVLVFGQAIYFESFRFGKWNLMHPYNKIVSFVVITASYLRFSYAFRPRRESATFLIATKGYKSTYRTWTNRSGIGRRATCVLCSRRQLVPFFSTISISDKSPKVSTTNPGWHFWWFVRNGDCRKKGD